MFTKSRKRLCSALAIAAISIPIHCSAETISKEIITNTEWKNEQLSKNANTTISSSSAPDISFTGYSNEKVVTPKEQSGTALFAKTSGEKYNWEITGLGDISVTGATFNSCATSASDPLMYQSVFKSFNMRRQGYTHMNIHDNGDITFSGNVHNTTGNLAYGSTISQYCEIQNNETGDKYNRYTVLSIENNGHVLFDNNKVQTAQKISGNVQVSGAGLTLAVPSKDMSPGNNPIANIRNNKSLTFSNNTVQAESQKSATAYGAGVYSAGISYLDFSGNEKVVITGNTAKADGKTGATSRGAGIIGNDTIIDNASEVIVTGNECNSKSESGFAWSGSALEMDFLDITNSEKVTISNNTSRAQGKTSFADASGVSAAFTTITGNGQVEFKNNASIAEKKEGVTTSASGTGGAVFGIYITIADNKNVEFRGNYTQAGDYCKLNAIYGGNHSSADAFIDVSAPEGGAVTFYDPIIQTEGSGKKSHVYFNKATEGVEGSGKGTIIFSAEHVAEDLAAAKGSTPTEAELEDSRTSDVMADTTQHGGLVQLKDDIIYKGKGYEAVADSDSVLHMKNASMLHYGYDFTMNKGTTLAVEGHNQTSGNMVMKDGSAIDFAVTNAHKAKKEKDGSWTFKPLITHLGEWSMEGTLNVTLSDGRGVHLKKGRRYALLDISAEGTQPGADVWNEDTVITTCPSGYAGYENYLWEGDVLYLVMNHDYYTPDFPALYDSNRGVFESSRAFNETVLTSLGNPGALPGVDEWGLDGKSGIGPANGSTRLWVSPYGLTSHFGGHGSIGGSDFDLYGVAAGAEKKLGRTASIGLAIGWDRGRISPTRISHIDQESTRIGLYGRKWYRTAQGNVLALDWAASYGRTDSEWDALDRKWSQDSFQIDLRGSHISSINYKTAFSKFIGIQYYAHNSDKDGDIDTSSLQNLRAEAGIGLTHALTEKFSIYGELAMHWDMVRNNPHVEINGEHYSGPDYGRVGGSATVGASYELAPRWTLFGSYSFEAEKHHHEHYINAGAVYTF